jgi:hypothetical protein
VTARVGQFPRLAFLLGSADDGSRTELPEAAQNAAVGVDQGRIVARAAAIQDTRVTSGSWRG